MKQDVYSLIKKFKNKYPMTVAWRLRAHAKVLNSHINPDEKLIYAFIGQKSYTYADFVHTYIVAITDKRILVAHKRILFGYFCSSITPDMFNDLSVQAGIFWGTVLIDTLSEKVSISFLDKKSLPEVETAISSYMEEAKQKYKHMNC